MLQLLPPVCRDCGKTADEAKLSEYLDFHLCQPCIGKREREVLAVDGKKRRPPSKKSRQETEAVIPKSQATKVKAKKPSGRGRKRT